MKMSSRWWPGKPIADEGYRFLIELLMMGLLVGYPWAWNGERQLRKFPLQQSNWLLSSELKQVAWLHWWVKNFELSSKPASIGWNKVSLPMALWMPDLKSFRLLTSALVVLLTSASPLLLGTLLLFLVHFEAKEQVLNCVFLCAAPAGGVVSLEWVAYVGGWL